MTDSAPPPADSPVNVPVPVPEPAPPPPVQYPPPPPIDAVWAKPPRTARPLLGTAMWSYGALLWAYLVVGEIVVWTAFPEFLGLLIVLGAFGLACYRGTSQMPGASRFRRVLPGLIAFFCWFFSMLVFTAMFGTGSRSQAEMTTLLLWFLAAIAYAWGRHLVALDKVPLTGMARGGRIALWIVTAIATLMAGANIISYA